MTGNREEIARLMEFAMVHADAAEEVSAAFLDPVNTTDLFLSTRRRSATLSARV